jgi:carbamoyltransferase
MKDRNYIGLACTGHDNALAIANSKGEIVFAEATERYLQNKRAISALPDDLVRIGKLVDEYCEPDTDIVIAKSWSDKAVDVLGAEYQQMGDYLEWLERREEAPAKRFMMLRLQDYRHTLDLFRVNVQQSGMHIKHVLDTGFGVRAKRNFEDRYYDHHLTHAATASFTSPYDEAAVAVIDGFGEGTSCSFYKYSDGNIQELEVPAGNMKWSLGSLYVDLTSLCGFEHWKGEEWKVMGLAPYGKFNQEIYDLLRRCMDIQGLQIVRPPDNALALAELFNRFSLKPGQHALKVADLAYTGQLVFSELARELLQNFYQVVDCKNLVLGGGCGLNSTWNGQIVDQTDFESLHVFAAPADDGNAMGAALLAYHEDNPGLPAAAKTHSPYLGSTVLGESLDNFKRFSRHPNMMIELSDDEVADQTARLLSEGKIIGWVQGRAEFGPRALGNRSIITDPRPAEMKDKINASVKFREEFRPFAPSILHEYGDEYFENYQFTPYMERTLQFRPEVQDRVRAVVHANGSGRLQSVTRELNPKFHRLISEFNRLTGVPIVLNTSFNVMGKPIIHSVGDAIAVFYTSGLDVLVIENVLIQK